MSFPTDLRYATRALLKSPGFTAVAVATLALGIGATAAIFSVVRGVLLEPLPFPEPERIVQLWQVGDEGQTMQWSGPNFIDVRDQSRSFEAMAAYYSAATTVTGAGEAARVPGATVTEGFFDVLGVRTARGRGLLPEDFVGGAAVVVVSHGYWQGALGGDPDAVGRTLQLDESPHTVVGVLPPGQGFPSAAQLWIPGVVAPEASRTAHNYRAIARVADGVSVDQADRDVREIASRLQAVHGDGTWMSTATVIPLHEQLVGNVRPALLILLSAAGMLLLIACANVANLLLARATGRSRELAVRLALGAGRGRIMQQLLAESAVLALAAGGIAVALAFWGVDALLALEPGRLPRIDTIGLDWPVLLFALGASTAAALGIGLVTAIRATRTDVREALTEGGRGGTSGAATGRLRGALVVAQVALTLVLLVGAGLLSRSFLQLIALDPGYRTTGALAINVTLPGPDGGSDDPLFVGTPNHRGAAALDEVLTRLGAMPGSGEVGAVNALPLSGGGANGMFLVLETPGEVESFEAWDRLVKVPGRTGYADYRVATPGYFEALEVPLLRGRLFDEGDGAGPVHAALVSQSLAETQWPGEDPVGRLIQFGNMDGVLYPFRVVGVVGDVRNRSLEAEPQPTLYGNAFQRTTMLAGGFDVVVAGEGRSADLVPGAREIVRDVTPDGPAHYRTLDEIFAASLAERRFSLLLLGVFGLTALVLATLGIYGVISYTVAQRTHEIGIRMALGAERGDVLRLIVRHGLILTLVGLVIGLAVSYAVTRVLASQLYGVSTMDPVTFLAGGLVLVLAALVASYAPASRATRVEPTQAFRYE